MLTCLGGANKRYQIGGAREMTKKGDKWRHREHTNLSGRRSITFLFDNITEGRVIRKRFFPSRKSNKV